MKNTVEISEEFNNFMYRVNEVSSIVKKLSSSDKDLQNIGTLEADRYLKEGDKISMENIDEEDIKLTIKTDRSVINRKALLKDDNGDPATMSKDAFMEEISRDADRRYKDKQIRKEKAETFKKQASLAFGRGEYEKALNYYNKAIEQIRDGCQLYLNRCLTQILLERYDKAIEDATTGLRLNEDSLKGWLLLAKAHLKNNNKREYQNAIEQAKQRNPDQVEFIDEYIEGLENMTNEVVVRK